MTRLAILSDDLTGSMETGIQFAKQGLNANVVFDKDYISEIGSESDVLIVDMESRNIPVVAAYKKVDEAFEEVKKNNLKIVYKKIDSTLRGNVGIELEAVMSKGVFDIVVLMPALPFNGRTTAGGYHYLNGVKVTETDLGKDPFSPVRHSYIPDILKDQTSLKTCVIELGDVRLGEEQIVKKLDEAFQSGCKVAVMDAESDSDVEVAASAIGRSSLNILPCGSSALFSKIFGKGGEDGGEKLIEMASHDTQKPVLVITGSPAKMSKLQMEAARKHGEIVLSLSGGSGSRVDEGWNERVKRVGKEAMEYLLQGRNVVIDGAGEGKEEILNAYKGDSTALFDESKIIQDSIASLFCEIADKIELGGVMITGGDTVLSICSRISPKGLRIRGMFEPFIPLGNMHSPKLQNVPVITKSGGFGNENTVVNAIKYMKKVRLL